MRIRKIALVMTLLALFSASNLTAGSRIHSIKDLTRDDEQKEENSDKADSKKLKPYKKLIKDLVPVEGLFTFYKDTTDNSVLISIKPEQFGPIYLCGESLTESEGRFFDNGSMRGTFPFYFEKVGQKVRMMEKNLRLRTDSTATLAGAVKATLSDHLFAAAKIKSKPNKESGAILISADDLFLRDASNVGQRLGKKASTGHSLDKSNSFISKIQSFPENVEIDVRLHYKTSKYQSGITLQSGYSMFHTYHYSLSSIPETDYRPRLADDRIGYFMTMYQDYSEIATESPYVRYIERWHLKKKNPDYPVSEPVEPIVFWIENTVPHEYREMMKEAIEWWNPAFEKAGFKNALVAKQMPDTASWDPADTRYNVIQWMVAPGRIYAVGPHRSNPFTGEIYDADIRFSADWVRYMFIGLERFVKSVSFDGQVEYNNPTSLTYDETLFPQSRTCNYQQGAAEDAAFAVAYLTALSPAGDLSDSLTKEFVSQYLIEILAHEVGHTIGLRHNFKASTIYTLEQINDPAFTAEHSTVGTIMDYAAANIAGPDKVQGDFYAKVPGPHDDWVIEYGYKQFEDDSPEAELEELEKIASRAGDPLLVFATDEDTFGRSTKAVDPLSTLHDLGDDPLKFALHKITLTETLWSRLLDRFEKPGVRYSKIRSIFGAGWRSYSELAQIAPKYVGGLYISRAHVGDKNGTDPFVPVSAADQRRAVRMLKEHLFAANVFDLPAEIHNKLQPNRYPDFEGSTWGLAQLDYPFHQFVLYRQKDALNRLYSPFTLGRLLNNVQRMEPGDDIYPMLEMFTDVRRAIWGEIVTPENVNSFRRQLQLVHLDMIVRIVLANPAAYPTDARTLAANDLDVLIRAAKTAVGSPVIDAMTRAHFKQVIREIDAAWAASLTYAK